MVALGDSQAFKSRRVVSLWLGLTTRRHSTGSKPVLLAIRKLGNRYLCAILIYVARSVLSNAEANDKIDPFNRWACEIATRRWRDKVIIANANKMTQVGWVVLAKDLHYDSQLL